jgi:hypothetical protein
MLLGGMNLAAGVKVTGDVETKPSSLYLGVLGASQSVVKNLSLKSRSGQQLKWVGAEVPEGVQIESTSAADGGLDLVCRFLPELQSEAMTGRLRLRVQGEREWVIQVPYIGSR